MGQIPGQAPGELPAEEVLGYGGLAAGTKRVRNPVTKRVEDVPLPNTPRHDVAYEKLQTAMRMRDNIDIMQGMIEESGTELFGADSKAMATVYSAILADQAKLRDLGTLQKSDIEFVGMSLIDPSTYHAATTRTGSVKAQYGEAQRMATRYLKENRDRTRAWGMPPELMGEAGGDGWNYSQ